MNTAECSKGHPLSPDVRDSIGRRYCKTCRSEWNAMYAAGRPNRAHVLEDSLWLLRGGIAEHEVMHRLGYTNRLSWLRAMQRAGLPRTHVDGRRRIGVLERLSTG